MDFEQAQDNQPQDKLAGMNCPQKLGDFCLICFSKVDRSKLPKQDSLLSNNLNAIFLLKNLLQVPSDLLIGNFKKCGSPAYWISLCEDCSQLTSQAMEHHLQILKLVNQLRSVLKIITEKMRESSGPSEILTSYQDDIGDDKRKNMQEKRFQILKDTREFVTNYDYNIHLVNPFIKGDKLARKLDQDQDSSSSENSEEEDLSIHRNNLDGIKVVRHPKKPVKRRRPPVPKIDKWTCQLCHKEFKNKHCLTRHQREQHPSIPGQFKCDICGNTKNSRFGLLLHRRNVHKINAAGNPITIKPRDYTKRKERRKLQPKHPSTCHLCGNGFTDLLGLKRHLKYFHERKYDTHCHVCGIGMWSGQSLKLHLLRKHKDDPVTLKLIKDGVRIWKCGVVGCRAISWKENGLEEHRRKVHGGGGDEEEDAQKMRFTCAFCGKTFRYGHKLKVHELGHQAEKQFSCDLCGAKFKLRSSIRKHKKRFHSEMTT